MRRLNVIAKALNGGNLMLARIAALQVGLPELPDGAAVDRMAAADRLLKANFNPDEPRDCGPAWWRSARPLSYHSLGVPLQGKHGGRRRATVR